MANFNFSEVVGTTVTFATADTLTFDITNNTIISAADIVVAEITGGVTITTASGTVTLTGPSLASLGSSTLVFADGSKFFVGDGTTSTSLDVAGNDIDGSSGDDYLIGQGGSDTIGSSTETGNDIIEGGDGADDIDVGVLTGQVATIKGGAGADTITQTDLSSTNYGALDANGNAGADSLIGGRGDDTLKGGQGNDTIDAGEGTNDIRGNLGDDNLTGGTGDDSIRGGSGNDVINGVSGNDWINGNKGDDNIDVTQLASETTSIMGGSGNDSIDDNGATSTAAIFANGNIGDDSVESGAGNDTLRGGQGNDTLDATDGGNNDINGNKGDDSLLGGAGNDTILGGTGNDTIKSLAGNDSLLGEEGADSIIATAGDDTIKGGTGNDTIDSGEGLNDIRGNAGNDNITGGSNNDTIYGGEGNDTIDAEEGSNLVQGDNGDDSIVGGTGNDTITGGTGNDDIAGGGGDDSIDGGAGNDTIAITGGAGEDATVTGGTGADVITTSAAAGAHQIDGGAGNDTITANGTDKETIIGGAGDDSITVASANQAADDDAIIGGTGNDTLFVTGTTALVGSDLANVTGIDTIDLSGSLSLTLSADVVNATDAGTGIEIDNNANALTLDTSAVDSGDVVTISGTGTVTIANTAGNIVTVKDGIVGDVDGGTKADVINGGDQADALDGGSGNDTIVGNAGADAITGGAGADSITGGNGADSITGGAGIDQIILSESSAAIDKVRVAEEGSANVDVVTGFTTGASGDQIHIDISAINGGSISDAQGTAEAIGVITLVDYTSGTALGNDVAGVSLIKTAYDADIDAFSDIDFATGNITLDGGGSAFGAGEGILFMFYDDNDALARIGYIEDAGAAAAGVIDGTGTTFVELISLSITSTEYTAFVAAGAATDNIAYV